MYDDVESDFWKDVFVHMQHKNMIRTVGIGPSVLSVSNSQEVFDRFSYIHPELKPEITKSESYVTWELFLTGTIKLRLFIQNGIKASLLQKNGNDLIKIADAKFHVNPFPEIEEIIKKSHDLEIQLQKQIDESVKVKKQQKLAGEFIKAILKNKLNKTQTIWNLKYLKEDFSLELQNGNETKTYNIGIKSFKQDLDEILK